MLLSCKKHRTYFEDLVGAAPSTARPLQRRSPQTTGAGGFQTSLGERGNT